MIVNPPKETYDLVFPDWKDNTIQNVSAEDVDVALALHAIIAAAGPRPTLEIAYREVVAQCFQDWKPRDITVFIADALRRPNVPDND
jgi:hypothetical protein